MPVDLGGVTFKVKVTAGKSAASIRRVAEALSELDKTAKRVTTASSKIATANASIAKSSKATAKAAKEEASALDLPDRVVRNRIRMVDRIAKAKRKAANDAKKQAAAVTKAEIQAAKRSAKEQERFLQNIRKEYARAARERAAIEKSAASAATQASSSAARARANAKRVSKDNSGNSFFDASADSATQLSQAKTAVEQRTALARKQAKQAATLAQQAAAAQAAAEKATTDTARREAAKRAQTLAKEAAIREKATKRTAIEARKAGRAYQKLQRDIAKSSEKSQASIHGVAESVSALSGFLTAQRLGGFIKSTTLLAGRVENLDTVMRNTGRTANFAHGELTLYEDQIKKLGITTQVTRTIMTRFAQNSLDVADAVRISRIAQDAAVVAGVNSSVATDKLAVAIQRLDTRMLRNLGILVNLRQEYQAFGLQTGRVETSLTAAEKQQIVLNAVIREGAALAGNYEASLQDVFKRFTSLDRKVEEASRTFGEQYLPIFALAVDATDAFLEAQTEAPGIIKTTEAVIVSSATAAVAAASAYTAMSLAQAALARTSIGAAAAVGGLNGVIAANPAGAAFILGSAAVAGIATAASSIIQQQKAAKERIQREAESALVSGIEIKKVVAEIDRYRAVANRTDLEDSALLRAQERAIDLSKNMKTELRELTGDVDAFREALVSKEVNPGIDFTKTTEQVLSDLRTELEILEKQRDAVEAANKAAFREFRIIGTFTDPGENFDLIAPHAIKNRIAVLEAQITAGNEVLNSQKLRDIEKSEERAETALQLAQRVSGTLEDSITKATDNASLSALQAFEKFRKNLTVGYQSIDQIDDAEELRKAKAKAETEKAIEAARSTLSKSDFEERKSELEFSLKSQNEQIEKQTVLAKKRREETRRAIADLRELERQQLSKVSGEVEKLDRRFRLLGQGISSDVIDGIEEFDAQQEKAALTTELFETRIQALGEEIVTLQRAIEIANPKEGDIAFLKTQLRSVIDQKILTENLQRAEKFRARVEKSLSLQALEKKITDQLKSITSETMVTADEISNLEMELNILATGGPENLASSLSNLATIDQELSESTEDLTQRLRDLRAEFNALPEGATATTRTNLQNSISQLEQQSAALERRAQLQRELVAIEVADASNQANSQSELAERLMATTAELETLNEVARLTAADAPQELIQATTQLAQMQREAAKTSRDLTEELEETAKAEAAIANTLKNQDLPNEVRKALQARLNAVRSGSQTLQKIRDDANKIALEKEKQFQQNFLESQKKASESSIEQAKATLKQRQQTIQATNDFILDRGLKIFGQKFAGQQELISSFRGFRGAVGSAGTAQQINDIGTLFQLEARGLVQQITQAAGPQAGAAAFQQAKVLYDQLRQQAESRAQELRVQDEQIRLQVRQTELLSQIYNELRSQNTGTPSGGGDPLANTVNRVFQKRNEFPVAPRNPYRSVGGGSGNALDNFTDKSVSGIRDLTGQFTESQRVINDAIAEFGEAVDEGLRNVSRLTSEQSRIIQQNTRAIQETNSELEEQERSANRAMRFRGIK